jgi:hypothetical protein
MQYSVRTIVAWLLLTLAAGFNPCLGQGQEVTATATIDEAACQSLEAGSRVRLELADGEAEAQTVTGTFQSCEDGMLVLVPENPGETAPISYRLDELQKLEVSKGKSNNVLPGAAIGLLIGLVISANAQTNHHQDEFMGGFSDMEDNIQRGTQITVGTTLLGAVIGGVTGSEKWEAVDTGNWNASLGTDPQGRVQMMVSCSF